jgi:hypothetical protein
MSSQEVARALGGVMSEETLGADLARYQAGAGLGGIRSSDYPRQ